MIKLGKLALLVAICVLLVAPIACSSSSWPTEESKRAPAPLSPELKPETSKEGFGRWWEEYRRPFHLDVSLYPTFHRGAWASRIDEARSYSMVLGEQPSASFARRKNSSKLRGKAVGRGIASPRSWRLWESSGSCTSFFQQPGRDFESGSP